MWTLLFVRSAKLAVAAFFSDSNLMVFWCIACNKLPQVCHRQQLYTAKSPTNTSKRPPRFPLTSERPLRSPEALECGGALDTGFSEMVEIMSLPCVLRPGPGHGPSSSSPGLPCKVPSLLFGQR